MSFSELDIQACYDSDKDDILNDFYIPVLKEAKEYWRLAGFFSSTSLAIAARGVSDLLQNDGVMKIVVGAVLTKDDVEAIIEGKENPKKIIEKFPFNDLNNIEDQIVKNHVRVLAWMVANKKLDIRVAIVKDSNDVPMDMQTISSKGIFHMKVGVLIDNNGNMISFSGSDIRYSHAAGLPLLPQGEYIPDFLNLPYRNLLFSCLIT
jgi:hypothetical protein